MQRGKPGVRKLSRGRRFAAWSEPPLRPVLPPRLPRDFSGRGGWAGGAAGRGRPPAPLLETLGVRGTQPPPHKSCSLTMAPEIGGRPGGSGGRPPETTPGTGGAAANAPRA